jgi:hypothetical protein
MNVREIASGTYGTIVHFAVTALGFTAFTVWLIFAAQRRDSMIEGLKWPARYIRSRISGYKEKKRIKKSIPAEIEFVQQVRSVRNPFDGARRPPQRRDTLDIPI